MYSNAKKLRKRANRQCKFCLTVYVILKPVTSEKLV